MANIWSNLKTNLEREKFLAVTNIIVMTVTFFILGLFVFLVIFSQTALKRLENQAKVAVFFKDDFTEEHILDLKTKFEEDARVSDVSYISKEQAFKIFSEVNKDQPVLLKSASSKILPASLWIKAKDLSNLSSLADEYSKLDGVEEVKYYKDVIERFKFWSNVIYIVGFVLVGVFLIISYSIIIVTLRTTIHAKGPELEILKLVGASDAYVKSPLVYQGVFFGISSSAIATMLLIILSVVMSYTKLFDGYIDIAFVSGLHINSIVFSLILGVLLIVSGAILGYLGSYLAIKRYLKY